MAHCHDRVECAQCEEEFRCSDVGVPTRRSVAWYCTPCSAERAKCHLVKSCALVTVDWEHYGVFQGEVHGVRTSEGVRHHLVWYDRKDEAWHDLDGRLRDDVWEIPLSDVPSSTPAVGETVEAPNLWGGGRGVRKTVRAVVVRAARVQEPAPQGAKWPDSIIHLLEFCGERHWHCFGQGATL